MDNGPNTSIKRKAGEDYENLIAPRPKRSNRKEEPTVPPISMAYPNGAIRISRTKGRKDMKNCVSLSDIIQGEQLVSACICSTFIEEQRLHTLLQPNRRVIPIYIVREMDYDPGIDEAKTRLGITYDDHSLLDPGRFRRLTTVLDLWHQMKYGPNWCTYYTRKGTQSSNVLLLVYPTFLRITITSSLQVDTNQRDNHWYIHDLPRSDSPHGAGEFESDLLNHLVYLGTPETFIARIKDKFDFTTVKVSLIASDPRIRTGGLLSLKQHLVRQAGLNLYDRRESGEVQLEVCASRAEYLSPGWFNWFYQCALGRRRLQLLPDASDFPNIKVVHPTNAYVVNSPQNAPFVAINSGPNVGSLKDMLHQYESKDPRELSTQNFILAYNPQNSQQAPYYVYIGSADLTISAWGFPVVRPTGHVTGNTSDKTQATCGVFILGDLIHGLLKEGTGSWQEGIVTYVRSDR